MTFGLSEERDSIAVCELTQEFTEIRETGPCRY